MSRRMQLAILAGTLLILLCCCSGLAARLPRAPIRPRLDLQAPSAAGLRSRLTEKLRSQDLKLRAGAEAGCAIRPDRLIVPAGARCEIGLPASSSRTRQLVLALKSDGSGGASVAVRLVQPSVLSVDQTLRKGNDPLPLDVYRSEAGGEATLTLQGCSLGELPEELKKLEIQECTVEIRN